MGTQTADRSRRASPGWPARCRTPSCTATPTTRSSTGRRTPRSWSTEAARLGLEALALTDHNGFYGIVRFAEAARAVGLPTVFGTEVTLTPGLGDDQRVARGETDTLFQVDTGELPDAHAPDPHGEHLVVLADGPTGYAASPGR